MSIAHRYLLMSVLLAQPALGQLSGGQLQAFRDEANAFNREDPFANLYRAGYYNGYLTGLVAALQGRSLCFKECPCEIDKLVGEYLERQPELRERPAADWLVPLLEARYPCHEERQK